jgi:hypothetical protein
MQPSPATQLPPFDQAALDRRFLTELARLLDADTFASYAAWAAAVGASANYVAAIAGGRYHCSLKLLYNTLRAYPATNYTYVLFGDGRPEPVSAPRRQRGRPRAVPVPAG